MCRRDRHGLAVAALLILMLAALGMGAPLSVVAPALEMSMRVGGLFGVVIPRDPVSVSRLVELTRAGRRCCVARGHVTVGPDRSA